MISRSGISGAALVDSNRMARDALQERRHGPPSSGRPLQCTGHVAGKKPAKKAGRQGPTWRWLSEMHKFTARFIPISEDGYYIQVCVYEGFHKMLSVPRNILVFTGVQHPARNACSCHLPK